MKSIKSKLPNFIVLTKQSVLDIPYESSEQNERDCRVLVEEQYRILKEKGYDLNKFYYLHFYDSYYTNEATVSMEIEDAVQLLAIKDGYDLVEFENGRIGFVAYYNLNKNGFEILFERMEFE